MEPLIDTGKLSAGWMPKLILWPRSTGLTVSRREEVVSSPESVAMNRWRLVAWQRIALWLALLPAMTTTLGCCCCSKSREQGQAALHTDCDGALEAGESQLERGRRAPVLDAIGWVVGIPSKILMLNYHVNNHNISLNTEVQIQAYLAANGLDKVKVRLNEYAPLGEWRRLVRNKSVGWPLRYTFGTLAVAEYTLLPGRVFGGDYYNPYTNSIYVYSDVPAIAVLEGGYSRDYAQHTYKGLYAVAYGVPGMGMFFQDARASREAIAYYGDNGTTAEIRSDYRTVYPAYAINASRPFGTLAGVPVVLPAVVAGHLVGQTRAYWVEEPASPSDAGRESRSAAFHDDEPVPIVAATTGSDGAH
jgi:hypothetical protein